VTLAESIEKMVVTAGARPHTARGLARAIIRLVREHDAGILEQLRPRPLPLDDCPDGCIVGVEWRRRALVAEDRLRDG
jgi:hypothetical protein